jgi:hypothetical protein
LRSTVAAVNRKVAATVTAIAAAAAMRKAAVAAAAAATAAVLALMHRALAQHALARYLIGVQRYTWSALQYKQPDSTDQQQF